MKSMGVGALVLLTALVGCSPEPDDDGASATREILRETLVEADEKGIDPDAREVLVAAMDAGRPISLEEVKQAQLKAIECVRAIGFDVKVYEQAGAPGGIAYMFGIPGREGDLPEDMAAKAYACEDRSVGWLDGAYQRTNAPRAENLSTRLAPYRAALVDCVESRGASVPASIADAELLELAGAPEYVDGYELPCVAVVGFDNAP